MDNSNTFYAMWIKQCHIYIYQFYFKNYQDIFAGFLTITQNVIYNTNCFRQNKNTIYYIIWS